MAAIFALSAKDADHRFVLISYFPVFVFWFLDGYFLYQERLFRKLFEEVAADIIPSSQFTMNTETVRDMVSPFYCVLFSKTVLLFHGAIVAIVLFAMFAIMRP